MPLLTEIDTSAGQRLIEEKRAREGREWREGVERQHMREERRRREREEQLSGYRETWRRADPSHVS